MQFKLQASLFWFRECLKHSETCWQTYRTIRDGRFNPDLSPGERVIAAADALTGCEDQDPQPHECEEPSESEDELENLLEEAEPINQMHGTRMGRQGLCCPQKERHRSLP